MKITIKVTQEILAAAMMCGVEWHNEQLEKCGIKVPTVSENCAIALAVREIFPRAAVISNFERTGHLIRIRDRVDNIKIIILPETASKFIQDFDRKAKHPRARLFMEPISFEVEMPDELVNEIGISEIYRVLSESRTLEMVM